MASHPPNPAPRDLESLLRRLSDAVAEREQAERAALRWARQQERVAALSRLSLEGADLRALLAEVLRHVTDELAVDHAHVCGAGPAAPADLSAGAGWLADALPPAELAAAVGRQAAFTLTVGEPVLVSDLARERRFDPGRPLRKAGAVAALSVPIQGHPGAVGVLAVYTKAPREFAAGDVAFLRAVANALAAAMRNDLADRALRESEARLRAVVDTVIEGIVTIDDRGTIHTINPAACRLFGYARDEVVGRNVNALMPEPYRGEHDGYMRNYLRTGRARIIGIGREVSGRRKDGTVFPLDLGVSEFRVAGRRMFAGVLRDITDQRRLEREIVEVGAQEQRRIGQDLHDGLCQELTGISFALEVLGRKLAGRDAPETASIRKVADLVDQSITHARALAHGLQPVTLDAAGLAAALQELAAKVEQMFHVSCLFVCGSEVLVHDNVVATHLFRIAQEAISNAVKHGKAKTIVVDLSAHDGWLRLTVSDDGVGVDKASAAAAAGGRKGIGLQTMVYRARVVGGRLDVRPGERGGTVVVCSVPLQGVTPAPAPAPAPAPPERAPSNGEQAKTAPHVAAPGRAGDHPAARPGRRKPARPARAAAAKGLPRRRPPHGP
jgi:PAS domain S-box-containing protein